MSETIGFIGLGHMGLPMAMNLLRDGRRLRVYNRTASKAQPLRAAGAEQVEHPADTAGKGAMVFSMVSDDEALKQVAVSDDGLARRLGEGGIHVSMSTVSPDASREAAKHHRRFGAAFLAAPVFGRPEAAEARKLWICLSGDREARERVRPVLTGLGQGLFDLGDDTGAANVIKLAGNFLIVAALEALAEAMTLVQKNGIDRGKIVEILCRTLFSSPVYENYGKTVAEERYTPAGFRLALGLKDVDLVLQTAKASQAPMPMASLLHDRILSGLARGRGDEDWAALAAGVSEDAGLRAGRIR